MYSATLRCGTVLTYEARDFLPISGERVPCRRHGHCCVHDVGRRVAPTTAGAALPRARPRTRPELEEWLRDRRVTSVHALKRARFTLRMIADAERDGLVTVDLEAGRVWTR
jgi:hypothetical protein